jgi:hypothetical protein
VLSLLMYLFFVFQCVSGYFVDSFLFPPVKNGVYG